MPSLRYLHMADAGGRVPGGADLSERRLNELAEKGSVRAIHDHMESMKARPAALVPLVQGRDLIALGIRPGPNFAKLIAFAQELQDDGQTKEQIIQQVIAKAATLPAKGNPLRRNPPVKFITDDSAFNRPHSSAWVHHDGFVKVLEPGFTHEQDIDWAKVQSVMPQYDPVWQQPIKEMTPEGYWLMRNVGWIAIGNPFHSRAYVPSFPSTPEALAGFALYLASAVIWHARRRENLLDVEHELTDIKTAWYVSPNPVGTYIHRYAAPGVESAMYTILESLPRPTREARPAWVETLERQKRESEREGWK